MDLNTVRRCEVTYEDQAGRWFKVMSSVRGACAGGGGGLPSQSLHFLRILAWLRSTPIWLSMEGPTTSRYCAGKRFLL